MDSNLKIEQLTNQIIELQQELQKERNAQNMVYVEQGRKKYLGKWVINDANNVLKINDIENIFINGLSEIRYLCKFTLLKNDVKDKAYILIKKVLSKAEILCLLEEEKSNIENKIMQVKNYYEEV